MPFIPNTPEALIARSDSKNPTSTCRGLTSSGRPCRRPSPAFCWQHTDQTPPPPSIKEMRRPSSPTIKERASIDTLVERLGLLEIKRTRKKSKPKPRPRSNLLLLLCCIGETDEPPPPRPAKRPTVKRDPSSRTGELLSLIPKSASPQTTSLLLTELAKPFSKFDDPGYIYMFWLTPESSTPPVETASSLLSPRPQPSQRRTSDVLNTYASTNKKTILLKIGRSNNVSRRLNEWKRQCGYDLSLIRYYPYHQTQSSTNVNEVPRTPRKVANVNRVERLIHLELADKKVQGSGCSACGREHREWFEVEANKNGVKAVDEIIRRWVGWGERMAAK